MENIESRRDKALILIADDVVNNVKVLRATLEKRGYDISVAYDGISALESARELKPDIILLDVMMPGLDGYEVCEQLKHDPATLDIPVIFLTVKNEINDVLRGFELGSADYINKPFNPLELAARVKTHLDLKRSRDANKIYISQLTAANEKLAATSRKLEELNINKDKFFSIVAHDLRNPFQGLLGLSDVLVNNFGHFSQNEIRDLCNDINNSAINLYGLLENLLSWSRIQMGTLQLKLDTGNLRAMTEEAVVSFAENAREKDIILVNNVGKDHRIHADINMVNTVIRNIISNSIKFTPRNGRVTIESGTENGMVRLTISDTGVGMNPEEIDRLFHYKSHFSRPGTENERGTGLGLILVKEFVEQNNGKIVIKSDKGIGTSFTINLPAAG